MKNKIKIPQFPPFISKWQ